MKKEIRRSKRSLGLPAALAALLMLLAACGGGQGGGGGADSDTIRMGFSAWPGWLPWQIADEKGFFSEAGLEVDLTYFESYTDSLNALAAGRLDANTQTLNDTITPVAAGSKQVIVLVNDNSTGNDQIIVREGINSPADLRGAKIGIEEGTVDHFLLLLRLDRAGIRKEEVEIQPLVTDAAASAFSAGQLDAVGAFAPFTTKALERPGSKALFTSADFPGAIPDHLVFTEEFVEDRPDDVQKMVDVWFRTIDFIRTNNDEAVSIMAKRAGVSVEDYRSYEKGTTIFTREQNLAAFEEGSDMTHLNFAAEEISEFLLEEGLIEEEPDLRTIFNSRFVEAAGVTETASPDSPDASPPASP